MVFRYVTLTPSVRLFLTIIDRSGSFLSVLGLPLTVLVSKNNIALVITSIYTLRENQAESFPGSVTLGLLWSARLGR